MECKSISRPGLYVMVFMIWLHSCTEREPPRIDEIRTVVQQECKVKS